MMSTIECPYCEHDYFPDYFEGHLAEQEEWGEEQCPKCEKFFMSQAEWSPRFRSKKADCMNGGDHDWEDSVYLPSDLFTEFRTCKGCNEEIKKLNPNYDPSTP